MRWFKHDTNAHRDTRLKKLLMKYGIEAYGLYWYCLEEIAHNVTPEKFTFELEHDSEVIAFDTGMQQKKVEDVMRYMVEIGLFENTQGTITCLKLAKRLDQSMTSNQEIRNIISKVKNHDSVMINHDSVMINHDGVMTGSCPEEKRREEKRINSTAKAVHVENSSSSRPVPYQKIIDLYHERLPMLPRVQKLTPARKQQIRARWQARDELSTLDEWDEYFRHVAESKFLTGQAQPMNGRPVFRADLDFLIKQANLVKVAEGKYHR